MKPDQGQSTSRTKLAFRWLAAVQAVVGTALLADASPGEACSWLMQVGGAGLLVAAVCSGWWLPLLLKREQRELEDRLWLDTLRMLSHYRHDVMNRVQLVKGYLQMQKYDRIQQPVQELIYDAYRHSALSNLPATMLAYALLKRDLCSPLLRLQVELEEPAGDRDDRWEADMLAAVLDLADTGETLSR